MMVRGRRRHAYERGRQEERKKGKTVGQENGRSGPEHYIVFRSLYWAKFILMIAHFLA